MRDAVSTTAETPLVTRPRPLLGVRGWRLAVPRVAVDREPLLRGLALFALAAQVALTVGLILAVSARRTLLAPAMNRGGEHFWLTGPLHAIAPYVPEHRWELDWLFAGILVGTIACYVVAVRLAGRIGTRTGIGAIAVLHAVLLIGPTF